MIYELPTRSPIVYRGRYRHYIRSWSYGRSPSQKVIADHLGINCPVHIELNNGRRYIAAASYLFRGEVKINANFFDTLQGFVSTEHFICLTQAAYDVMLAKVREARL